MAAKDDKPSSWEALRTIWGFIMFIFGIYKFWEWFGFDKTFALYCVVYGMSTIYKSKD